MKSVLLALVLSMAPAAYSAETCFELSADGQVWSRTPELLCISEPDANEKYGIALHTGDLLQPQTIATYTLDLLSRSRCIDCNADLFGVANPTNSVFNALQIRFEGQRDFATGDESGTVQVGGVTFHYRTN